MGKPEIKAISKFLSFIFRVVLLYFAFNYDVYVPYILGSSYLISEIMVFCLTILILSKLYGYKLNFLKFKSLNKLIN